MKVEIKHHYGWRMYDVPAETLAQAAYLAIRQTHEFLTDENHTHQAVDRVTKWAGHESHFHSIEILRNERSTPYSGPAWAETPYWIAVQYRATAETAVAVIGVDIAQEGADSTVQAEVDVNQGTVTVKAISGGRRAGKATAAKKALAKATTQNPDLTVITKGASGVVVEKPVKGQRL